MKTKPCVLMLFNLTDAAPKPWLDAGYTVVACDVQHRRASVTTVDNGAEYYRLPFPAGGPHLAYFLERNGLDVRFVMSFAPCTDMAVSGAAHFENKRAQNPQFQDEAVALAKLAADYGVPYMVENPVSVLATLWRKPDHYFHPCDYGGYLPEDDVHPLYSDVLPPRDAYNKKTCLWTGNGFIMPTRDPVPVVGLDFPGHTKLGGKSLRTKNIRSATPRGFAKAVFEANKHHLEAQMSFNF